MVDRTAPYLGEPLYREESYSPTYKFGEGDWVLVDIDESGGTRQDKDGKVCVLARRTIAMYCRVRHARFLAHRRREH